MNLIWYLDFEIGDFFYKVKTMDCYFCRRNQPEINWQNTERLKPFLTGLGKIRRKDRTGLCAKHQRQLAKAVKRARHLGLLPYTF